MSTANKGRGAVFSRNNSTDFDVIGEVVSIAPGGISKETIETTALNPADGFRTFIGGVKDASEVSVTLNLDPAIVADAQKQGLLYGDVAGDVDGEYKIAFSDGGPSLTFTAVATGFEIGELTVDGKVEATFNCKPSGKPVWADA